MEEVGEGYRGTPLRLYVLYSPVPSSLSTFCLSLSLFTGNARATMTDLSKELWYHGRISRLDAEQLLDNFGRPPGSFLVRDSLTTTGEYVLSLSFQGKKYHYIISRHPDGSMAIQDGAKFDSPIELIQYHTKTVDGLITTLKQPCCRLPGQPPQGYRFISHEEMQMAMREAALLLGYQVRRNNCAFCTCWYAQSDISIVKGTSCFYT